MPTASPRAAERYEFEKHPFAREFMAAVDFEIETLHRKETFFSFRTNTKIKVNVYGLMGAISQSTFNNNPNHYAFEYLRGVNLEK